MFGALEPSDRLRTLTQRGEMKPAQTITVGPVRIVIRSARTDPISAPAAWPAATAWVSRAR